MKKMPMLGVVIPTFGLRGVGLTEQCLYTLKGTHDHIYAGMEVIVVEDGGSPDALEALSALQEEYKFKLMSTAPDHKGFAVACNTGLREIDSNITFLVNNDIEFTEPTLQLLTDFAVQSNAGVVGCRLLYPGGQVQHGGVVFVPSQTNPPGYFDHVGRGQHPLAPIVYTMRPSLVTGALFGISRWALTAVGFLDERFGFSAEDIDYCLRVISTGRDSLYMGYTSAIHHEGATRGATPEQKALLAPDVAEREAASLKFLFDKWPLDWSGFSLRGA